METRRIATGATGNVTVPDRLRYVYPDPVSRLLPTTENSINRSASVNGTVIYSWGVDAANAPHGAILDLSEENPTWSYTLTPQTFNDGSGDKAVLGYTFFAGSHFMFCESSNFAQSMMLRLDGGSGGSWVRMTDPPVNTLALGNLKYWEAYDKDTNTFVHSYVSGGVQGILRYDLVTDTWSYGTPQPTPVYDCGVAAHHGTIYTLGGLLIAADDFLPVASDIVSDFQLYDIASDSWSTSTPFQNVYRHWDTDPSVIDTYIGYWASRVFPRSTNGSGAVDGNLYFFGGIFATNADLHNFAPDVFSYNTNLGAWTLASERQTFYTTLLTRDANTTVIRLDDGTLLVATLGAFVGNTWGIFDVEVPNQLGTKILRSVAVAGNSTAKVVDATQKTPVAIDVGSQVTVPNSTIPGPVPPPGGDPPPVVDPP